MSVLKLCLRIISVLAVGAAIASFLFAGVLWVIQVFAPFGLSVAQRPVLISADAVAIVSSISLVCGLFTLTFDRRRGWTATAFAAVALVAWILMPVYAESRVSAWRVPDVSNAA